MIDQELPEGWYEYITSPRSLTKIAYVRESGEVYLPDADFKDDWENASIRTRLVREEDVISFVKELGTEKEKNRALTWALETVQKEYNELREKITRLL